MGKKSCSPNFIKFLQITIPKKQRLLVSWKFGQCQPHFHLRNFGDRSKGFFDTQDTRTNQNQAGMGLGCFEPFCKGKQHANIWSIKKLYMKKIQKVQRFNVGIVLSFFTQLAPTWHDFLRSLFRTESYTFKHLLNTDSCRINKHLM